MRVWAFCVFILGILSDFTTSALVKEPSAVDARALQVIYTDIGETIDVNLTRSYPSCYVRMPSGATINFEGSSHVAGLQLLAMYDQCVVRITVSESAIGLWALVSKTGVDSDVVYEIIHHFQVVVERQVKTFPQNAVTIEESTDFHIRLLEPTDWHDTCRLVPPNEEAIKRIESEPNFANLCAYVVYNVNITDSGKWEITYGTKIQYRASVELTVTERAQRVPQVLYLVEQTAIDMEVGPENAVYCQLENPNRVVVFNGFGRCKLNLNRVDSIHSGQWKMFVGIPRKVVAETFLLNIHVVQPELKSQVQMSISMSKDDPSMTVSCSVETSSAPRVCKFLDPQRQILIAQEGVGEGRYTFQGAGVSTNGTDKHSMDCGLRISSPTIDDLGIWRCAVETESDTYYGFHLAICPWLATNGSLPPSVVTEPRLKPRKNILGVTAGDIVEMTCTIPSQIRYCYFRASNGTVFTVSPGQSNAEFEYVGNGFDAGECGIRLRHISSSDYGRWTCNVGIVTDGSLSEQSVTILMFVNDLFAARLSRSANGELRVLAVVNSETVNLEYCRFVRSDGSGFTNELLPYGYEFQDVLHLGRCELHILRPTTVDFQSWTVAVGIRGQQYELIDSTGVLRDRRSSSNSNFFIIRLTLICICISLLCLSLGLLFSSKEKRRWTYARAAALRESVRRSFRFRKPAPVVPPTSADVTTSQAA